MTLVLSVHNRDTIFLLADRRLSFGGRRTPIDDAVKVMAIEASDDVALLGYAGLGRTPRGTQPSDWMSAVLRGWNRLSIEQALSILSAAANKELPKQLAGMPGGRHTIVAPAFVRGVGARLFTIDNIVEKGGKHSFAFRSHQHTPEPGAPSVRLALAGTGGAYLGQRHKEWTRPLFRLLKAHDRGDVSDLFIADHLAKLNNDAHRGLKDGTVGPRCIVVWKRRKDPHREGPGGGHQFYTGIARDQSSPAIPAIANGMDVRAIAEMLISQVQISEGDDGTIGVALDEDEIRRLTAELPDEPDDRLR